MNFLHGTIGLDGEMHLDGGPSLATGLSGLVARTTPATLGLRPTDIELAANEGGAEKMEARVERAEYAGSDVFWDCVVGGQSLRVRVGPDAQPGPDGRVRLAVAPRKLHVFGEDGERLGEGLAPAASPELSRAASG